MDLNKEVILRPRFKIELNQNSQKVLNSFDVVKNSQIEFIITKVDAHVFIKIPMLKRHFWSPQLHLEIIALTGDKSLLKGLFGPNPTVWTMFMFLHFLLACLFIGFGIWFYTNWSLAKDYKIQILIITLTVLSWVALYVIGRIGKASSNKEMKLMYSFMLKALKI